MLCLGALSLGTTPCCGSSGVRGLKIDTSENIIGCHESLEICSWHQMRLVKMMCFCVFLYYLMQCFWISNCFRQNCNIIMTMCSVITVS